MRTHPAHLTPRSLEWCGFYICFHGVQDAGIIRVPKRTNTVDVQLQMSISPSCNMDAPACKKLQKLRQEQAFQVCDNLLSEVRREPIRPSCVHENVLRYHTTELTAPPPCTGPGRALVDRSAGGYYFP